MGSQYLGRLLERRRKAEHDGYCPADLFRLFHLARRFEDPEKNTRISAVYNIFAFVALIPYLRHPLTDSLHPGAGGNPAFGTQGPGQYDAWMVFYPAVIGWTLLGF